MTDEQHTILKSLSRKDLQRLAKMHGIRGNQTNVGLVEQLSVVLPSSTISAQSTKWAPKEESADDGNAEGGGGNNSASAWLAPDDVEPTNRRIMKTRHQGPATGLQYFARDKKEMEEDEKDEEDKEGKKKWSTDITDALDPDAECYEAIQRSKISCGGRKGLEVKWSEESPSTIVISEGVPLSVEQIVHILAENNARDIHQYDQIRVDAEHYVIATGLSLRHVRSLKDALVHSAKKTKVAGLSSSNIASSGKRSPMAHWELIDLREIVVHIMTSQGRKLYNLEGLWKNGITEKDLEDGF
jgi:ribosome silencing factor RsfS/YbeB/iojap